MSLDRVLELPRGTLLNADEYKLIASHIELNPMATEEMIKSLKAVPQGEHPIDLIFAIKYEYSANDRKYTTEAYQSIVQQILNTDVFIPVFYGHSTSEKGRTIVGSVIGAHLDEDAGIIYYRIIPDASEKNADVRRWLRNKQLNALSIWGYTTSQAVQNGIEIIDNFTLLSVDLVPPLTEGQKNIGLVISEKNSFLNQKSTTNTALEGDKQERLESKSARRGFLNQKSTTNTALEGDKQERLESKSARRGFLNQKSKATPYSSGKATLKGELLKPLKNVIDKGNRNYINNIEYLGECNNIRSNYMQNNSIIWQDVSNAQLACEMAYRLREGSMPLKLALGEMEGVGVASEEELNLKQAEVQELQKQANELLAKIKEAGFKDFDELFNFAIQAKKESEEIKEKANFEKLKGEIMEAKGLIKEGKHIGVMASFVDKWANLQPNMSRSEMEASIDKVIKDEHFIRLAGESIVADPRHVGSSGQISNLSADNELDVYTI